MTITKYNYNTFSSEESLLPFFTFLTNFQSTLLYSNEAIQIHLLYLNICQVTDSMAQHHKDSFKNIFLIHSNGQHHGQHAECYKMCTYQGICALHNRYNFSFCFLKEVMEVAYITSIRKFIPYFRSVICRAQTKLLCGI